MYIYYEHTVVLSFIFDDTSMKTFNVIYSLILRTFERVFEFSPRQNQNNTCEQGGRRVKVIFPMWLECFLWTTKTLHLGLQIQTEIVCLLLNYPDKSLPLSTNFWPLS